MKTRYWFALAASGGAALVALSGWWWRPQPALELLRAPIAQGSVAATVEATGILEPIATVLVGTYVSGRVVALDADFNSAVRQGQRIAKIDPLPFAVKVKQADALVATATARVARARADLALQQARLARQERLRSDKVVAQEELDAARSAFAQAVAQVDLELASVQQAEAALDEARINLGYTDIVSPVDGVVLSRDVDVGQTVAAAFQTPILFQLAEDLTQMRVTASVSESDIGPVAEGQTVTFGVDAYPERRFAGTVVQVRNAPISVQNVVTYDVLIHVDNRDLRLKPGMTANVTIVTERRDDVRVVPVRALRFRPADEAALAAPQGEHVWVDGGTQPLRPIAVELGLRGEDVAELLGDALHVGDEVVLGYVAEPRRAARSAGHPD